METCHQQVMGNGSFQTLIQYKTFQEIVATVKLDSSVIIHKDVGVQTDAILYKSTETHTDELQL